MSDSGKSVFDEDAKKIIQKEPEENGIIEQFDGYFQLEDTTVDTVRSRLLNEKEYWGGAYGVASDTQIIKQADVVTQLVMFPEDFSKQIAWKNWNYYEPRTEHGSSLSACMYGILACSCGYPNAAYPFFRKSAEADLKRWRQRVGRNGLYWRNTSCGCRRSLYDDDKRICRYHNRK